MWPEDVKCPIVVGLAGLDKIVPINPIRRLVLSHPDFTRASPTRFDDDRKHETSSRGEGKNDDGDTLDGVVERSGNGVSAPLASVGGSATNGIASDDAGGVDAAAGVVGSNDGPAKRVEVLFWSGLGHAWALGHPRALNEFMRVANRQLEVFGDV